MPTELPGRFGLKSATIDKINAVFARVANIEQVLIYGSRAKGNYRPGSDIDLTIKGDHLGYGQLLNIITAIDDLLLPYKVDISLYKQLDSPDLLAHIQHVGQVFYQRCAQGKCDIERQNHL